MLSCFESVKSWTRSGMSLAGRFNAGIPLYLALLRSDDGVLDSFKRRYATGKLCTAKQLCNLAQGAHPCGYPGIE